MKPFEEKILDISIEDAMRERADELNTAALEQVGAAMGDTTNLDEAIISMCRTQRRKYHTRHVLHMVRNCAAVFLVCLIAAGIVICSVEALRVPVFRFFSGADSTVITVDGGQGAIQIAGYLFRSLPPMDIVDTTENGVTLERDNRTLVIQILKLTTNHIYQGISYEELQIGEFQAFCAVQDGGTTLLLLDQSHVISLHGQFSKEEMIAIANGIEKK